MNKYHSITNTIRGTPLTSSQQNAETYYEYNKGQNMDKGH
jgi:hypothetical protein